MKYAKKRRKASGLLSVLTVLLTLVVVGLAVYLCIELRPWELLTKHLPPELESDNNHAKSVIVLDDDYKLALYYPEYLKEDKLAEFQGILDAYKQENESGQLLIDYHEDFHQDFVTLSFHKGMDNTQLDEEIYRATLRKDSFDEVTLDSLFKNDYLKALAVLARQYLLDANTFNIDQRFDVYCTFRDDPQCYQSFRVTEDGLVFDSKFGEVPVSFEQMSDYLVQTTNTVEPTENTFTFRYIDPLKPMIALTFDDGPYTSVSNRILDALEAVGGRATFFVVGSRATYYQDVIKREYAMGCEVGSHTYEHLNLTKLSVEQMQEQYRKVENTIHAFLPEHEMKVLRPVGGAYNSTVLANTPYSLFNWSVDTLDWKNRDGDTVYNNIMNNAGDGDIVLMHDLYPTTADAVEKAVPELAEKYQLVTVLELLEYKGVRAEKNHIYFFVH